MIKNKSVLDAYDQVTRDYLDSYLDAMSRNNNSGCYTSVEYYPPGHEAIQQPQERSNGYYDVGGIEVIDYIAAKLTPEQYKGYLLGNIYKYSGRMQYKGEELKDVKKLANYTQWLTEHYATNT